MDETFATINPSRLLNCPNPSSHISRWSEVAVKVQRPGIDAHLLPRLIRGVADLVARTELGQNYEISSYGGSRAKS